MFTLPNISKSKDRPLYLDLYEAIKESIIHHELNPDEKLPSKRALANNLGVSIRTVENAYDQLLLEGYIYTLKKKGYYVENLENYRVAEKKSKENFKTSYFETEYKVNLRANRNSLEDFPANVWSRLMRETLNDIGNDLFKTVPFNGTFELRKQIALHLRNYRGMVVSPDQIIIGAGTEYLYSRLNQMLGATAKYALPDPSTKRLRELYENNNFKYSVIPTNESGPDISVLEKSGCNILHISPAHQYPLGIAMLIPERIHLLEWANLGADRYIIEDDYDSEYVITGKPIPPVYSMDIRNKVIYMNTFSKSVSPAVRVSYMVLPPKLMQRYLDTMSFYSCTVASFEQYTLAKFIEKNHLERYIRRVNRKNIQIRNTLNEKLKPLIYEEKVQIISGSAGAHILLKLRTDMNDASVKKYFRSNDIITSMLSEYYVNEPEKHEKVMVINYSGLNTELIDYLVSVLNTIL